MPSWSELLAQDLARFELELTKYGITPEVLIADIQDVPELRSRCDLLTSGEQRLKLAVEWFGDRGKPQPKVRRNWRQGRFTPRVKNPDRTYRTPDWGPLGRPEDAPAATGTPGRPEVTVTSDTLHEIFRQSLERARSTSKPKQPSYQTIASDNDVGRTWVTPIVKWAEKHQQVALDAIRLSEIPARFSTIVRD